MWRAVVNNNQSERGVIAIFLATILAILLLTTTTYAARVSVSELNQSSQIDQSEAAYYAAEAGVEDAIRRIDQAPQTNSISDTFPLQFGCSSAPCGNTDQPGDMYDLSDPSGNLGTGSILTDTGTANSTGQLSWRHRRVYEQSSSAFGTLVKDQTQEWDTTLLQRRCAGGGIVNDSNPTTADCSYPGTLHSHFTAMQFCWINNAPDPVSIEVTAVRYPNNDPSSSQVTKNIVSGSAILGTGVVPTAAAPSGFSNCLQYNVDANYRYILRIKPIYTASGNATNANGTQNQLSITYRSHLLELVPQPSNLSIFIPNQSYIIDVVGQSGDIQRRIVARKLRNGQLLGIFDYVLYSGDPVKDLCKIGVSQSDVGYDPFSCSVEPADNGD